LNLELALLKSTFNAEHFVRGLSWFISSDSAQFTLEMYVPASNRETFTKTPNFGI